MKMFKQLKHSVVVILVSLISLPAWADLKTEIIASCIDYQSGTSTSKLNACKLYIDGFIDAALLSEDGVAKPQALIADNDETSSYLKRAYQTRVLETHSILPDEESHQFCIPIEYQRHTIASMLAKSLDISQLETKTLKEVVFETLVNDYPCD
ncbi:hypothetical protein [Colwellia sp. MEBiC06753]